VLARRSSLRRRRRDAEAHGRPQADESLIPRKVDLPPSQPPLIAHVIHALGVGGLENGLVNLINRMPPAIYRHTVVCMTTHDDFSRRIRRHDVELIAMRRAERPLAGTYFELYRHFRRLKPAIVHSRNLSGLDALVPALLAGVRLRVHGEHGRDADDLDGRNPRNLRLRRLFRPLVTHYSAVSRDLERYLIEAIGVHADGITQIYNGVDTSLFRPTAAGQDVRRLPRSSSEVVFGTVGRLQPVKDQLTLVKAFIEANSRDPEKMRLARLVIVGDGPCRPAIEQAIADSGAADRISLLGERSDVAELLRSLDVFVLPSLNEGISNTVLEAMATGLPVLATRVGGNPEIMIEHQTGELVVPGDCSAMASWLIEYARNAELRSRQGGAGRRHVQSTFSMDAMVSAYIGMYDRLLHQDGTVHTGNKSFGSR